MGNEVKAFKQRSHLVIIVPLIQTHALSAPGSRIRPPNGNAPEGVSSVILKSFLFAPSITHPMGMPLPSVKRLRFMPCLARSVGLGPLFFPRQGRFAPRPIHRTEAPINAFQFVVALETLLPERPEYARLAPLLEPAVGGARGADARCV
jgi:hypothetical protein